MVRLGLLGRLRGRGPFTVIPLTRLSTEQRLLLIQALREELVFALAEHPQLIDDLALLDPRSSQSLLRPSPDEDMKNATPLRTTIWQFPLWIALVLILIVAVAYWYHDKPESTSTERNFRIINLTNDNMTNTVFAPLL